MSDLIHQQLLGHLLGALDDDEQAWLDARLEQEGEYRTELARWRRALARLEGQRPEYEPPLGLAERTCQLVGAWGLPRKPTLAAPRAMSPDLSAPQSTAQFGWADLATLGVVLLMAVTLILPAIDGSRSQARLASCQGNLRQVGTALTQYSQDHLSALSDLAADGRLTDGGVYAAEVLNGDLGLGDPWSACPNAWVAFQGSWHAASSVPASMTRTDGASTSTDWLHSLASEAAGRWFSISERRAAASDALLSARWSEATSDIASGTSCRLLEFDLPLAVGPRLQMAGVFGNEWPGIWRDGTVIGLGNSLPATLAMSAHAPSVYLPGQILDSRHREGRNVFFEDGHVDFVPCLVTRDAAAASDSGTNFLDGSADVVPVSLTDWQ